VLVRVTQQVTESVRYARQAPKPRCKNVTLVCFASVFTDASTPSRSGLFASSPALALQQRTTGSDQQGLSPRPAGLFQASIAGESNLKEAIQSLLCRP